MATNSDNGRKLAFGSDGEEKKGKGCLVRTVAVLFLVALILLGGLALGIRTEGARTLIEDHLRRKLGTEISIGRCRIAFPYVFVMEKLRSKDVESADRPAFGAEEVRFWWGPTGRAHIEVRRFVVRLVKERRGEWEPAVWSRLGDLPSGSVAEIGAMVRSAVGSTAIRAQEGSIHWISDGGRVRTAAEGIEFVTNPVKIGEREFLYFRLKIDRLAMSGEPVCQGLATEWLASEDFDFIPLVPTKEALPEGVRRFWVPTASTRGQR
ncbi:MAG: hypothetical protein N2255_10615 [Kiritimatiellae bacterium]|nr:hypothetical protein [Kiritimatiellia bacterium]